MTYETKTRAEHLAWAKERALTYADQGDTTNCVASMASDLGKHPDLADHAGLMLGVMEVATGHLSTPAALRHWVEGFN